MVFPLSLRLFAARRPRVRVRVRDIAQISSGLARGRVAMAPKAGRDCPAEFADPVALLRMTDGSVVRRPLRDVRARHVTARQFPDGQRGKDGQDNPPQA